MDEDGMDSQRLDRRLGSRGKRAFYVHVPSWKRTGMKEKRTDERLNEELPKKAIPSLYRGVGFLQSL